MSAGDVLTEQLGPLVPTGLRDAVLERLRATSPEIASTDTDLHWPADVAPQDVADWLREHAPDASEAERIRVAITAMVEAWSKLAARDPAGAQEVLVGSLDDTTLARRCALAALAFRAWRAIQRDLRRPAIAVDTGRAHHDLVTGMRDLPKDRTPHRSRISDSRVEILAPDGRAVQLTLPVDPTRGLHQATVETLRQWRGWQGVRHWAALLRLFSIEGGRSGSVRWTLEAHLDALGYADRARRDLTVRRRVAAEVELLTQLELAVYAPDGHLRARQPLLAVGTRYDALQGAAWALEGMELRINEWVYRGVRNPQTGEVGNGWYPAPIELAQIDHVRFPHAIVLGLILPSRWRWDLGERDHCALSGANLLATAGITISPEHPGRAWEALRRNLDELQRRNGLGQYDWQGPAWSMAGVCRLFPPQWARDRTVHRLAPLEPVSSAHVLTGAELVSWRRERGLSQAKAARLLGVGIQTVKRAESTPEAPLGPALRTAMKRV